MKNSIIENLIAEVMMSISRTNGYLLHATEKVREAQALSIMGRIEPKEVEARKTSVTFYTEAIAELQSKLEALEALR